MAFISAEERDVSITKSTFNLLLTKPSRKDRGLCLSLYCFYYYCFVWQKSKTIWCTDKYVSTGLGWCLGKVSRVRKQLEKLGLIEILSQQKKDGKFGKQLINVKIYTGHCFTGHGKPRTSITYGNTLSVANKIGDGDGLGVVKTNKKNSPNKFDNKQAKELLEGLQKKRLIQRKPSIAKWPDEFRKLRELDKISKKSIREVLGWYLKNMGDEYVPQAFSAKSFREKFDYIIAMMRKSNRRLGSSPEVAVRVFNRTHTSFEIKIYPIKEARELVKKNRRKYEIVK